jgi:ABC-2 type transport system permease protein
MPFNLLNSDLSNADLLISIATLVVTIIIVTATSIKIYTASVLHYGKGLKLK